MFILFHIFVPLLCVEILLLIKKEKKPEIHIFWIIVGSIFPDLIDKPLFLIFGIAGGRGYFHTPLLLGIISLILFLLTKNKNVASSFGIGTLFHLLLDIPAVPWLWPIVPITIYESKIEDFFYTLFNNPLVYSTEIIGLIGLLWIGISKKIIFHHSIINWRQLQNYLFIPQKH
ncbi:hypothetical protein NEF87_003729 [Candidatus Lokiarchaeum ossiferum]|uniref:Metal-dependent hydrolase n=1 Tax=Candidatus Lokiarchaeum ossiferum TaxID=2951803 RepID=A0ABY6HYC6_9ARCH|nr:hypothetical protein NEF87_003729 [Candidatus Lokiarchaeum sp. B-35]